MSQFSDILEPEECLDMLSRSPILKRNDVLTRPSTKMLKGKIDSETTLESINNLLAAVPSLRSSPPPPVVDHNSSSSLDDVHTSTEELIETCEAFVKDKLLSDSVNELRKIESVNKILSDLSSEETASIHELSANCSILNAVKRSPKKS